MTKLKTSPSKPEKRPDGTRPFSNIGPPPFDLFAKQADLPSVDRLLRTSLKQIAAVPGQARPGESAWRGTMNYDHVALVGPPTRLQGGYHGPARLLSPLAAIPEHDWSQTFPCAFSLRIGKAIRLFEDVPFTARYAGRNGEYWFTTTFDGTDRLSGAVWSITPDHPALHPAQLSDWQQRLAQAARDPETQTEQILNLDYRSNADLFWVEYDLPTLFEKWPGYSRFSEDGDHVSLGFLTFHLDNILILSQAVMLRNPMFTVQIGMAILQEKIPATEKLIMIADRRNVQAEAVSLAKPVMVHGRPEGSRRINAIVTNVDFSKVYAQGWATGHPMDLQRMMKG